MASEDLIREAQDPSTTAARLAELAQADRATWPAIVVHPAAYPGLLEWLGQQGDATVNAVLALRSGSAATPTPTEVIPTVDPAAQQPVAQEPVAPITEPVAPVTEPVAPVTEPIAPVSETPAAPSYEPVQPTVQAPAATEAPAVDPAPTAYGTVPPGGATPGVTALSSSGGDGSKRNLWVLGAMVAVIILLLGGAAFGATQVFGDDDDDKDEATSSQTTDSADEPADEPSDEPSDDVPSFGADDDGDSGSSSGGSGSGGPFCEEFKDLQDETLDSMGGTSGSPDLDKLTDSLSDLAESYADLEDAAPSEIKSDVAVMADYFDTFKDPTKVDPSEMSGKISDFSDAAQKVSQYYYSNCL